MKAVREFLGALADAEIEKGVFITLCGYTGDAKQLAEKQGIERHNGAELTRMLDSTGVRFDGEVLSTLRNTRRFCPKWEREMVHRTATRGKGAGKQFWRAKSIGSRARLEAVDGTAASTQFVARWNLSRLKESPDPFAFPTNGHTRESLEPFPSRHLGFSIKPVCQKPELIGGELLAGDAVQQIVEQLRRKIVAADTRHDYSP